jgi:hypothetical protein
MGGLDTPASASLLVAICFFFGGGLVALFSQCTLVVASRDGAAAPDLLR